MFSILVSEFTPEILSKAEYWRFMQLDADQPLCAETLHVSQIEVDRSFTGWNRVLRLQWEADDWLSYDSDVRCFPVSISLDGTEVRLECPRMPDEPLIAEWSDTVETTATLHGMTSTADDLFRWRLEVSGIPLTYWTLPPTPEHYPRRTCEGVWVWSTRR